MDREAKIRELEALQRRIHEVEADLSAEPGAWPPKTYYGAYYATTGALLGFLAASTSLVFNIVGSLLVPAFGGTPQHPLRLIQVYLTFPLGESALEIDNGVTLAIGCCLYLATGMFYGMVFQLMLTRFAPQASFGRRLVLASLLALTIWLINFYGILGVLQPLLFGGNWIIRLVPPWVGSANSPDLRLDNGGPLSLGPVRALRRERGEEMNDSASETGVAAPRDLVETRLVLWYFLAALAYLTIAHAGRAADGLAAGALESAAGDRAAFARPLADDPHQRHRLRLSGERLPGRAALGHPPADSAGRFSAAGSPTSSSPPGRWWCWPPPAAFCWGRRKESSGAKRRSGSIRLAQLGLLLRGHQLHGADRSGQGPHVRHACGTSWPPSSGPF